MATKDTPTIILATASTLAAFISAIAAILQSRTAKHLSNTAKHQLDIANDNLQFNIYERRFGVYLDAVQFMNALDQWKSCPDDEKLLIRNKFLLTYRESQFLFPDNLDIFKILDELSKRSFHVTEHDSKLNNSKDPQIIIPTTKERRENLEWINKSIPKLEELMKPYLEFGIKGKLHRTLPKDGKDISHKDDANLEQKTT